jgi:nucleoid DNA-binding protein
MTKEKKRDNYFYETFKSINKTILIQLVKNKIPHIRRNHIDSIIQILIDQLEEDLFKFKTIKIGNFIEFNLHRMREKRGRSYYTGEIITTKPFNTVKVVMDNKFSKKLIKYFDVESYKISPDPETKPNKE